MSEEKKPAEQLDAAQTEQELAKKRNAFLRYMTIVFAVAFLLVLVSLVLQMHTAKAAMSDLKESNSSALTNAAANAELLQDDNRKLQEQVDALTAELAERARPQAARAKPGQGAPKGRPRCGASWTAAAAWAMQEVFLYNIGKGGPVWSGGVLFLHRAGGCGIGWGSGKIPAKRASNFIDIDSR